MVSIECDGMGTATLSHCVQTLQCPQQRTVPHHRWSRILSLTSVRAQPGYRVQNFQHQLKVVNRAQFPRPCERLRTGTASNSAGRPPSWPLSKLCCLQRSWPTSTVLLRCTRQSVPTVGRRHSSVHSQQRRASSPAPTAAREYASRTAQRRSWE